MGERQLLHLVFGGELKSLKGTEFKDPAKLHVVGVYPSYASAHEAWQGAARATVDNAHMRYFIVHIHRLLDPSVEVKAVKTRAKKPAAKAGAPARKPAAKRARK
ncbi:MAG: DUF4170 domain-containing protein [Alphaproteobacteria bacterium]|nr:DUF4170 domain-containing protein [Alphaproteobacteria bacterium]